MRFAEIIENIASTGPLSSAAYNAYAASRDAAHKQKVQANRQATQQQQAAQQQTLAQNRAFKPNPIKWPTRKKKRTRRLKK
jgi:hypothetical protein